MNNKEIMDDILYHIDKAKSYGFNDNDIVVLMGHNLFIKFINDITYRYHFINNNGTHAMEGYKLKLDSKESFGYHVYVEV